MNKPIFMLFLILFFIACVALGFFAPPEIALPIAVVIFLVSTGIYRKQQQHKKVPKEELTKDL
jgi:TRAP-type C4-dicarboxylate transport system permease large subunit